MIILKIMSTNLDWEQLAHLRARRQLVLDHGGVLRVPLAVVDERLEVAERPHLFGRDSHSLLPIKVFAPYLKDDLYLKALSFSLRSFWFCLGFTFNSFSFPNVNTYMLEVL